MEAQLKVLRLWFDQDDSRNISKSPVNSTLIVFKKQYKTCSSLYDKYARKHKINCRRHWIRTRNSSRRVWKCVFQWPMIEDFIKDIRVSTERKKFPFIRTCRVFLLYPVAVFSNFNPNKIANFWRKNWKFQRYVCFIKSFIQNNEPLSDLQRFHYLSLKIHVTRTIQSLSLSKMNYKEVHERDITKTRIFLFIMRTHF